MNIWDVNARQMRYWQGQWRGWIDQNWQSLLDGAKLLAPIQLSLPADAGFTVIEIAHPVGQACDWGLGLPDGSRIHVHEYADGRRVVHRDVYDPTRGLGPMLAHLMQETPYGVLAVGIGGWFLITRASNA